MTHSRHFVRLLLQWVMPMSYCPCLVLQCKFTICSGKKMKNQHFGFTKHTNINPENVRCFVSQNGWQVRSCLKDVEVINWGLFIASSSKILGDILEQCLRPEHTFMCRELYARQSKLSLSTKVAGAAGSGCVFLNVLNPFQWYPLCYWTQKNRLSV